MTLEGVSRGCVVTADELQLRGDLLRRDRLQDGLRAGRRELGNAGRQHDPDAKRQGFETGAGKTLGVRGQDKHFCALEEELDVLVRHWTQIADEAPAAHERAEAAGKRRLALRGQRAREH